MPVTAASSGLMDPLKSQRMKIRMTTSWTDYLLCQLTSGKKLSTLECLPPEILDPILEEVHERSIDGLRPFSQASQTCRALASPYRFKSLRVRFDELVTPSFAVAPKPTTVTLSYHDGFKTLKVHSPSCAEVPKDLTIHYVLKAEKSIECIEFLPDGKWVINSECYDHFHPVLEAFNWSCPMLSRLIIGLGFFLGYSPGWDREYRESIAVRQGFPVKRIRGPPYVGQRIIRALASFQNLLHLTVHFTIEKDQVALMHPSQGQHAVREMYHKMEKIKEGVRLAQLKVILYTSSSYIFGYPAGHIALNEVRLAISYEHIDDNSKADKFLLTCDNPLLGKVIERGRKAVKLYGSRAWEDHFGPYTLEWWQRSQGKRLCPSGVMIDWYIKIALLPSIFRPPEITKYAQRGIFCM